MGALLETLSDLHYIHEEGRGPNPLPLLLPTIDLLEGVGQKETADRIFRAVEEVLTDGKTLTADLGGSATTTAMTDALVAALANGQR